MNKSENINYELEKNIEVISQLDGFVGHAVDTVLVDPDDCWQPTDFLPDMGSLDAFDQVKLNEASKLELINSSVALSSAYLKMLESPAIVLYHVYRFACVCVPCPHLGRWTCDRPMSHPTQSRHWPPSCRSNPCPITGQV